METVVLNNKVPMPSLGLGVYQIPAGKETEIAVASALQIGYRLIDTAAFYQNEASVGRAIKASGLPRSEIFVTTKLHPARAAGLEKAFLSSLKLLGLDYIDLYLIHWPFVRTRALWKDLCGLYDKGLARSIGVSNFRIRDIESLTHIVPAVNQVEFHPFLYRKRLLDFSRSKGIQLEAHSPLTHGKRIADPRLASIGAKYGKSAAQVLIRWSLQHGLVVIPKTSVEAQMKENWEARGFQLEPEDMAALDALNENCHIAGLSRLVGDPA